MAGDWIKMRVDLNTHPKVVRMASALNADRLRVIGGLHAVWCLFDAHSVDGSLDGYSPDVVDTLIGFPGFSAAMSKVEWLTVGDESVSLPRFDDHNGKSAKRRGLESERKRASRKSATDGEGDRNPSASDADKMRTREEKRRDTSAPDGAGGEPPGDVEELTDRDRIFAYGVPMLVNAGNTDKAARSFLAGKCKEHGDAKVVQALRDCYREQPVDPLTWLGKRLPMRAGKPSAHSGFDKVDYHKGVNDDGSFE